jgi:hypothetical protein
MSRLVLAVAAAAIFAAAAFGQARGSMSFAFGRTGGNIEPFTVTIAADGMVHATGPVRAPKHRLSARELAGLLKVLKVERFSSLPGVTRCAGALPDFASDFVTVRTGAAKKTVLVRGDCSPRFAAVYKALSTAVGVR